MAIFHFRDQYIRAIWAGQEMEIIDKLRSLGLGKLVADIKRIWRG